MVTVSQGAATWETKYFSKKVKKNVYLCIPFGNGGETKDRVH